MNTFATILEYLNSAPVSDIDRSSYKKIRRKNTWTGRVSLIKKMLYFSGFFLLKLTLEFPHLFHWVADPTEHIPSYCRKVQRMYHGGF